MAGEATVQFPLLQPAVDTDARCDPGIDTSYVLDADLLIASTIRKKRKRTESGDLPSPKEVRTAPGLSIPSTPEPNWGLLRPPEQISTEASRRSSFSDIPLPVPRLPQRPRDRLRVVARAILNWQKLRTSAFIRKPQDLCDICKGLGLCRDKFIIQDHSFDRNQQAYLSHHHTSNRLKSNFPLGSGSGKIILGTYASIRHRGSKCPFCYLVICSLKDYQVANTTLDGNINCEVSWQVDGREILSDKGIQHRTRPRTRRIRLNWSQCDIPTSYLVLKAPESPYRNSPSQQPWDFESIFLGRSIKTAGHNTALVKSWLNLCDQHHGRICKVQCGSEFEEMIAKSYFGVIDVHEMRLTSLPKGEKYIALSYVWGDGDRYKTELSNVENHKQHGGLEKVSLQFPRVISDSIKLVRSLGERYLWIDSLCIVQDSTSSWSLNASDMDLVYGNAYLTICAADGTNAKDPLKAITPSERHIKQYMEQCGEDLTLMVSHLAETYIERSRWNTRGWTFQERLLSKRCLIFAEGRVFFQCRSTAMSEDVVSEKKTAGWSIELVQAPLQLLRELEFTAFRVYMTCVELYTSRILSRPKDILAAFNGMSNLLGNGMGSPLVFGLPSSHFDLALLWQPAASLRRRGPINHQEVKYFEGMEFPSWSWCGWMGDSNPKKRPPKMFYNTTMLEGCLSNVQQWLTEHTWIHWYIRDRHGNLRAVWNPHSRARAQTKTEPRWRGYKSPTTAPEKSPIERDQYGRVLPERFKICERTSFHRTLPDYPYRVSFAESSINTVSPNTDKVYLQFWTLSAFLKLYPNHQYPSSTLGEGLCRYDITDYTGDWCGTIVLDREWGDRYEVGSEFEFLAISEAMNFSKEENDTWTYYIPKERDQSEWDLYYVLLVEHKGGIAHRVGLGKVFKDAFSNSCLPGVEWKEIILG